MTSGRISKSQRTRGALGAAMLRVRMGEPSCRQLICIKGEGRVPTMLVAAPRERFSLCKQSVLPTLC